jgi:hypothetical protein
VRIRQLLAFAVTRKPILAEPERGRKILARFEATAAALSRRFQTSRGAP